MTPRLSIVFLTYRPGGIDLLVESLYHQHPSLYELVVVDDWPGRVQRGTARGYAEDLGIPVHSWLPSKSHSYLGQKVNGLANAMNSGALRASTGYLVFLHDYAWLPPGAICQWLECRRQCPDRTLLSGIASVRNALGPLGDGDISIWKTLRSCCARNLFEETEEWVPSLWENFYTGIPISFLEAINGFDERADCGHISWPYQSTVFQAFLHNYQMAVDRRLRVVMANHRLWKEHDPKKWHAQELSIGGDPPQWEKVSPNPFVWRELREKEGKT